MPPRLAKAAPRVRERVLDAPIDVIGRERAVSLLRDWASRRESRVVFVCNVHSVVTARQDPTFREALERCDLALADGMPVTWMMRWLGHARQQRVPGPDLMLQYCKQAAGDNQSVFLYGGTPQTIELLRQRLLAQCPDLKIAGAYAPPFRPLTPEEDDEIVRQINGSGAGIVFVGLGCPKQEFWMAAHRSRIRAVMVGVGAAFDFHAGIQPRAPGWMQERGLEWVYRLLREPRRLWRRYLVGNTLFILGAIGQLLSRRAKAPANGDPRSGR